jgi:hypothetical protein
VTVRTSTSYAGIRQAADLALKHRLFVSGWQLSHELKKARDHPDWFDGISMKFVGGVPVALVIVRRTGIMAFCKKSERRKGYASECVQAIRLIPNFNARGDYGIPGSLNFWTVNGLSA